MFQTNAQIKIVDNMIGRLWDGLKDRSLEDKINIILVGDHGTVLTYIDKIRLKLICDL